MNILTDCRTCTNQVPKPRKGQAPYCEECRKKAKLANLAIVRSRRLDGANSHYNKDGIRYEKVVRIKQTFFCHYCNEPYIDTRQRRSVACCEECLPKHLALIAINKRENQKTKDRANYSVVSKRRRLNNLIRLGYSIEWYEEKIKLGCAVCLTQEPGGKGTWHIDHDRSCCPGEWFQGCGKCIRGILCHHCNIGIGNFHDSPKKLRLAAEYLERF